MINMRIMTAAYLFNKNNDVLMLKRSKDKFLASNLWTGIGGHVETYEYNNPEKACYREIFEESNIKASEIENLTLRYILLRRDKNEIRQHYIYFGKTLKMTINYCDEGELHWINLSEILNLDMPLTVKHMFKHFFTSPNENIVYIGSINKSQIEWSKLVD